MVTCVKTRQGIKILSGSHHEISFWHPECNVVIISVKPYIKLAL